MRLYLRKYRFRIIIEKAVLCLKVKSKMANTYFDIIIGAYQIKCIYYKGMLFWQKERWNLRWNGRDFLVWETMLL